MLFEVYLRRISKHFAFHVRTEKDICPEKVMAKDYGKMGTKKKKR